MEVDEALGCVGLLEAAYREALSEAEKTVLVRYLLDLDLEMTHTALDRIVQTYDRFPSIRLIRASVRDVVREARSLRESNVRELPIEGAKTFAEWTEEERGYLREHGVDPDGLPLIAMLARAKQVRTERGEQHDDAVQSPG